jgi:hypothetical protein
MAPSSHTKTFRTSFSLGFGSTSASKQSKRSTTVSFTARIIFIALMRIDDQVMEKPVRQRGFHVYVIPTDVEKMIAEHTVKHVDRAAC